MTYFKKTIIQGTDSDGNAIDILSSDENELKTINETANLNQYTQLELLTLMYEELQQINKTLKKIYQ